MRSRSQARVYVQSRSAARWESPRTWAASATNRPPKYRSWTNSAAVGSLAASAVNASSSAPSPLAAPRRAVRPRPIRGVPGRRRAEGTLLAGVFDEDEAHGLNRNGQEVTAARPLATATGADQAQVRLVDQGRQVECLPRRLVRQPVRGQLAQLVVDQGQELGGSLRVTRLERIQQNGAVVHGAISTELPRCSHVAWGRAGLLERAGVTMRWGRGCRSD